MNVGELIRLLATEPDDRQVVLRSKCCQVDHKAHTIDRVGRMRLPDDDVSVVALEG